MRRKLVAMLLCMAIAPASADALFCGGKIHNVLTYADGTVMVLPEFRGDWLVICNMNTERQGISPVTCVSWLASATRAMTSATRGNIGIYYQNVPSCAAVPTYFSAPPPVYVMSY